MLDKIKNKIWYEKYRPTSLDELSLPDFMRSKFEDYMKNPPPPHLLFVGLPGSGKTTISKIIINNVIKSPDDILSVNGSGLGVDALRIDPQDPSKGFLINFARKRPKKSPCNIIFIDEFDNASKDFYMRFRSEIETLNQRTKTIIIATANRINFDNAILQRFQDFYFNVIPLEEMLKQTYQILEKERVQYNKETVEKIVNMLYPSMRWVLQTLQKFTIEGVLQDESLEVINVNQQVIQLFHSIVLKKSLDIPEYKELVQLLRYQNHMIIPSHFLKTINYMLEPRYQIILAKHINNINSAIHLDIAILGLLADIIFSD